MKRKIIISSHPPSSSVSARGILRYYLVDAHGILRYFLVDAFVW